MDIQEFTEQLNRLEQRLAETEKILSQDKVTLNYLRGYAEGLDYLIRANQQNQ